MPDQAETCNLPADHIAQARRGTSFTPEELTNVIYGGREVAQQRRKAWARLEAELDVADTWKLPKRYADISREELYLDGLRWGAAALKDSLKYGHHFWDYLAPQYSLFTNSPFGLRVMFNKMLELMGSKEQQQKWLRPAKEGHINGAYVQTELGHGSFVRGLETTATFHVQTDSFVICSPTLTSTKFWPGGLGYSATHGLVMARLITHNQDYGIHPFLVQLRDISTGKPMHGVELGDIGPKMAQNANDNGYAQFNNVTVPRENMLMGHAEVSRDGQFTKKAGTHSKAAYGTMSITRANMTFVAAVQLAAAVTIAVRYSAVRRQGFMPGDTGEFTAAGTAETGLLQYQSQSYRLLTLISQSYAMLFASRCCEAAQKDFEDRQAKGDFSSMATLHALTAGMKAWSSTAAMSGAEDARKCCGAVGFMAMSALPELVGSAGVLFTGEGDNYVLWQQQARYLAKWAPEIKTSAPKLTVPHDLRYLATQPVDTCTAVGQEFLSSATQVLIFQHRAQRLVLKAAAAVGDAKALGLTGAQAWNKNMMLLISAARAHTDYVVLTEYVRGVARVEDGAVQKVLIRLCSLFALSAITSPASIDAITFVEDGFLSGSQLDTIRAITTDLVEELSGDAIGLTDAWDLSDASLGSVIGMKDGNVYERLRSWTKQLPMNVKAKHNGGVHSEGWEAFVRPLLTARTELQLGVDEKS
ncbi:acyl-coenzyme A oxidase 1 [Colletotrichum somersetense]|nr:acyl-coenzyme A oxidase 1 [Colletotrichum somersetense]